MYFHKSILLSNLLLVLLFSVGNFACTSHVNQVEIKEGISTSENQIELLNNESEQRVDVLINGELFTSYIYSDTLEKPVLYPIMTAQGTAITRGFPIATRPGERLDHPHHLGLWFNYGDVNGLDFWNNSSAIPASEKGKYGHIVHKSIRSMQNGEQEGRLEVELEWKNDSGETLLTENTVFIFKGNDSERLIDRISTLTAEDREVSFKDNKEGMLGLRVARQLEHPTDKPELFADASGKITDVPVLNNDGITGNYRSSERIEGNKVWGTRGNWVSLTGQIEDENIAVIILDHPTNPGFPTYWHARGYGLFAANPLGQKALSGGKEELNFKLAPNESVTFKYQVLVVSNQELMDDKINEFYSVWSK
jgi:hypothetical protein